MAAGTDATTRWWRGRSLRAKVTGVTVALLTIGLIAAGIGTAVFLRNTLNGNLEAQVEQLSRADVAGKLFDITIGAGDDVSFEASDTVPVDYYVAIYDKTGALVAETARSTSSGPIFPETYTLALATIQGTEPFTIGAKQGANFFASVSTFQVTGSTDYFTQLVALPTSGNDRVVSSFLGIYSILALLTIVAGALATRWLVTLAFRSLGQVEQTAMSIAAGDFSQRMTDIEPQNTEVGRLKKALNEMLARLDAALRQRDASVRQMRRFIGDASHELRTPLVTVRGYAELYRMGAIQGSDDTAQAMERIEKEAVRMGVLVEDLLALARLDERRDIVLAPVDLRVVARDAAMDVRATSPLRAVRVIDTTDPDPDHDSARPAAPAPSAPETATTAAIRRRGSAQSPAAGLTGPLALLRRRPRPVAASTAAGVGDAPPVAPLDLSAPPPTATPRTAPVVTGEDNSIRQIVANLIGNARRYTPDDSPIELQVGVDAAAGTGWIDVVDHGDGIPAQIRDKIFQRFWRADNSRTRETGGSGLGLSIVASLVEALHGRVRVDETPGGGATFRVSFPLARPQAHAEHLLLETQPLPRIDS